MKNNKCKICRRLGVKLFLKGERCFLQKCAMVKKPYPPGQKRKRRMRGVSEYGKELREKQKLKAWYNLGERQFGNYVKEILKKSQKTENAASLLIKVLEKRLDNVVFRLGLSSSRSQARQLVSHGQILINNRSTTAPGYSLKKGDEISAAPSFFRKNTNALENLKTALKKKQPPVWLSFNSDKLKGEVIGEPSLEEAAPPAEISLIFEFYSK